MRSQDAVYGMSNDVPSFSFVHEMLYICLKEVYPDLELGVYHHCADSFHVYAKHYDMVKKIVDGAAYAIVDCPRISSIKEVEFLRKGDYNNIPSEFKFATWLETI
jgi:thymidylate synthase